ncbi:unnamed protein product [Blepharisma stoltei]|uniref:RGS domain-containing protein n=1 Tax=Blepharisma stoltei TaxID=1481888 RepID=A0AAU9K2V9_9CILI|nr:unnamed protein product [Blepharisma stoltei]
MESKYLPTTIILPILFIILSIAYSVAWVYVYRRREYQELFAKSPVILLLSIVLSYTHTISSILLGCLFTMGEERDMPIGFPIMVLYCLSRHALYITTILKVYRLRLIYQIRSGDISNYEKLLNRKVRLTDRWNLKVIIIYTLTLSSIFVVLFSVQFGYNHSNSLSRDLKKKLKYYYMYMWLADVVSEEIFYAIYIWRIRKASNVGLMKTELFIYLLIWSLGFTFPWMKIDVFYICIMPIRNLLTMLVTILITNKESTKRSIIPLPNLKDSRMVLENFHLYETFRNFIIKSKNNVWLYYLNLLVSINVFKINNTALRAQDIYNHFFQNQSILPAAVVKGIKASIIFSRESNEDVNSELFRDVEDYIISQFDSCVYPQYCNSSEYLKNYNEMENFV